MSNLSKNNLDYFDYQRNLVNYKGKQFPIRTIWCDDYNCNVMFSVETLNDILIDRNGVWMNSIAEYIDNKIIYYVREDEIVKSDQYLSSLLKTILL